MSRDSAGQQPPRSSARGRVVRLVFLLGVALAAAGGVVAARWVRSTEAAQDFIARYPGVTPLPEWAPVGFPAWVSWTHFLSAFMLLLIIRTGLQLRERKRPANFYTRRNTGLIRTRNPPVRIGLPLWFHLSLDLLWVVTGVVYVGLLLATGQWVRIVPTSWDIVPNAVSAGLQYASLDWPVENSWVNYNSLQVLAYFVTVFIAAPLAVLTGLRLAPGLAARFRPLDRVLPIAVTRRVHVGVMIYFLAFIVVHVVLVLATGALRNLNHMYAGRDDESWLGAGIFVVSLLAMAGGWFAARPPLLRRLARLTGTVR